MEHGATWSWGQELSKPKEPVAGRNLSKAKCYKVKAGMGSHSDARLDIQGQNFDQRVG